MLDDLTWNSITGEKVSRDIMGGGNIPHEKFSMNLYSRRSMADTSVHTNGLRGRRRDSQATTLVLRKRPKIKKIRKAPLECFNFDMKSLLP